jgi:hypothetical protein
MYTGYMSINSITFNLGDQRVLVIHIMLHLGANIEITHLVFTRLNTQVTYKEYPKGYFLFMDGIIFA